MARTVEAVAVKRLIQLLRITIKGYYVLGFALLLAQGSVKYDLWKNPELFPNTEVAYDIFLLYKDIFSCVQLSLVFTYVLQWVLEDAYDNRNSNLATIRIPNSKGIGFGTLAISFYLIFGCGLLVLAITKMVEIKIWNIRCLSRLILLVSLVIILKYFPQSFRLCFSLARFMLG